MSVIATVQIYADGHAIIHGEHIGSDREQIEHCLERVLAWIKSHNEEIGNIEID